MRNPRNALAAVGVLVLALIPVGCTRGAPQRAPTAPSMFGEGAASFHPTEVAPYVFENTIVRLHFDDARGVVYGDETAVVRPKRARLQALPFDSLGIQYERITVNGRPASYSIDERSQRILVKLASPVAAKTRLAVEFAYRATPQGGIYFIRPDAAYPNVTPEIWSQGEAIDNRRWFPTWDEPNQKTPSELILTVPRGWTAVANGSLKSHTHTQTSDIWDWNSPRPKSTYLIAFAAGPLAKHHTALGSLDVDSFVQPPDANLNAVCFGRTNQMIAYYQRIIGKAYPFEKYDQVTAERFTFGGMENSSVAIQTALALHPATEDAESSCDELVSHELAQNWWGDDVTMADWSNVWINEGFATYFDELWTGHRFGEPAFEYARYLAAQSYFAETQQYFRPIVDYDYNTPLDLFDASGHGRPAQVLHMLRYMFGDSRFFGALHAYLNRYEYKNADTHAFFASIGTSLGTNLGWFEREWFYRAAHPHYYVSAAYDRAGRTLTLHVRQRNHDGKPFRMPVVVEAYVNGRVARVRTTIDRNDQVVTMTGIGADPQMVLFDPNNNILRQLTFPKSVRDLAYQLAQARHVGDREWALEQLGRYASAHDKTRTPAAGAVRKAALGDPFFGVRADAVQIAGRFDDAATVSSALGDRDVRVRIAAEGAAGSLTGRPTAVITNLKTLTTATDSNVQAAAWRALGVLRAPGVYDQLARALRHRPVSPTAASGALSGLAAYGDAAALPLILQSSAYGMPDVERDAAVTALPALAKRIHRPQAVLPMLLKLVKDDPLIRTRMTAAAALAALGDASAVPVLQTVEQGDPQLLVRLVAANAIASIGGTSR